MVLTLFVQSLFAQDFSSIKHIEVISEIQDSMALINNEDVNKINKVFFEKEKLDSLRVIDQQIIDNLIISNSKLDSIILNKNIIISNNEEIKNNLSKELDQKSKQYKKSLKKERAKKIGWQTSTGVSIVVIILILIL